MREGEWLHFTKKSPFQRGVEGDASYFIGQRKRSLRGRGVLWATSCFWPFKTGMEKFMQRQIDDGPKAIIQAIIRKKLDIERMIAFLSFRELICF